MAAIPDVVHRGAPLESANEVTPELALIVAVADNGVIGAGNQLPWRLPEDLRRFKSLTSGHTIIMGRKTWESLTGALAGRQNIVVSHQQDYIADGGEVARSLDDALARTRMPAPVFCIGGGELYRIALPRATRLYVTQVHRDYSGDATFPPVDPAVWHEVLRESHPAVDNHPAFTFVTFDRR